MDYRGLNKQTIKDRNPIPLISECLDTITGKIFHYFRISVAPIIYFELRRATNRKTAFITKYGQFEFLTEIKYLGYIISPNGTSMDPSKISAVKIGRLRKRQMNNAERNYDIYDKELLAVVESFKHWRHLLQGGLHPVTVLCDHKNLEYFYVDQETNSSTGSLVVGTIGIYFHYYSLVQESLTEERTHFQDERIISWTAIKAISSE
ncbi:hypothetical protein BASA83_013019 [Batrachochytrium salamandrivorans]|nr:hypothetical protein BASA83_013019 [Batrachochytrium salamandrivorans]